MSDMTAAASAAVDAIRPVIQMDGGDISFISCDEDTGEVIVELSGACVGCSASSMTLKAGVERILMDRVPGVTAVNTRDVVDDFALEA